MGSLDILGNRERLEKQAGQTTLMRHAFIGWGQGQGFARTLATLIPQFGPIAMLASGPAASTGTRTRLRPGRTILVTRLWRPA